MVNRPIGYDLWVYYVNFQSSLIVICGDQGPPNFCLHRAARMLRPALLVANGVINQQLSDVSAIHLTMKDT